MKKIISTLLFFFYGVCSYAQCTISGMTLDNDGKLMPFVNILLLNSNDSISIKGAVSDVQGVYFIDDVKPGSYFLSATMVGYKKIDTPPFKVNEVQKEIKAIDLKLLEDIMELKEVSVVTTRPFIEHAIDRTVVNVTNSIISSGSTALEVLEKAPGITIDRQNDGIALRGKDGVIVQIDGKQTYLAMADVVALLKSMPSDNIDKIELITNPSAKFDAAGNSGIINIVMKKNNNFGTNGSISVAGGAGRYDRERGSIQVNHRANKLNLFSNYSGNRGGNYWNFELSRVQEDGDQFNYINQDSYIRFRNFGHNAKVGLDYFITENTTVGFVWTGFWNNNQESSPAYTSFRREANGSIYLRQVSDKSISDVSSNHIGNINLQHTFGSKGGVISADFDMGRFSRDFSNNLFTSTLISDEPSPGVYGLFTEMPTTINIITVKTDYTRSLGEWKMEAGFKSSFVSSDNNMTLRNGLIGEVVLDPELSNHFKYLEQVNAFYTSFTGKVFEKTEMQVGLRTEHSQSQAKSLTLDRNIKRDYLNLFPSLFISSALSEKHNLGFSYSYRIDRPNYQSLNPARSYLDPYAFSRGNPFLKPQYTHAMELKYGFDNKIYTSIGANFVSDFVFYLIQPIDHQKTERTPDNIGTSQDYNLNISFPITITKSWTVQTSLLGVYNKLEYMYLGMPLTLSQVFGSINSTNSMILGKGWTAELSGWVNSPRMYTIFYNPWRGSIDAGIQKSFGYNWKAKFSIQDLLRSNMVIGRGSIPGYSQDYKITFDTRVAMLNLTYTFGNQQLKGTRQRKIGSEEEIQRTN